MEIFLITFAVMIIIVLMMAVGLLQNKQIKGSCGGLNSISGLERACSCSSPCENRLAREAQMKSNKVQQKESTGEIPHE